MAAEDTPNPPYAKISRNRLTLCLQAGDVHLSYDTAEKVMRTLDRALRERQRLLGTPGFEHGEVVVPATPRVRVKGPSLDGQDVEGPIGSDLQFPEGT